MFCPKPNSDMVRLVTDYTKPNKWIKRTVHGAPTAKEIRDNIKPTSRWFWVLDLSHGYYQIPLDEDSQELTTFLVSDGDSATRFCYNRLLQGLASSGDEFCARTDAAFSGIETLQKLNDHCLVKDETLHSEPNLGIKWT